MPRRSDCVLILLQLVIAAMMTGVIWFVQLVSYPQFLQVAPDRFVAFHAHYTKAIAPVVAPLMIAELGLALFAPWHFRKSALRWAVLFASALVVVLWLLTFAVQIPLHERLAVGWSRPLIGELIASNWLRTALWSLRLAILLGILYALLPPHGRLRFDPR